MCRFFGAMRDADAHFGSDGVDRQTEPLQDDYDSDEDEIIIPFSTKAIMMMHLVTMHATDDHTLLV